MRKKEEFFGLPEKNVYTNTCVFNETSGEHKFSKHGALQVINKKELKNLLQIIIYKHTLNMRSEKSKRKKKLEKTINFNIFLLYDGITPNNYCLSFTQVKIVFFFLKKYEF